MDSNFKRNLENLLNYGISAGADFVEIFVESTDSIGLLAEQDTVTSVNPSLGKGVGIRAFLGTKDGFVSTNDLSEQGLRFALDQALGMLGLEKISIIDTTFSGLKAINDYGLEKRKIMNECPSLKDISAKMLEATYFLLKNGKHISVRRGSYSKTKQEVIVAGSDGTYARDIRLYQSIGLNVLALDKDYRSSIGRRIGTEGKPSSLLDWDSEQAANEINESAEKMLYAKYVSAGQKPVVLANKFGGVIFHEACGHLLETTQIERGTTPFENKLNQRIANKAVTAVDEGLTDGAFGSIAMDDEGMETQKTILIQDGVLKRFLSDRAGQIRTGHNRTGSGRRQSYSFAAASRMRNTFIDKGPYTPKQLIESIDDGIYCKSMGGGSVGATGQFNFSVEEGYLIKNGKLRDPVKGATLIGEAVDIMPRISMCANDLELAPGFCGSVSGNINVTVGQPHIKVDSITIGGR
ncbi:MULTISPECIES: TldD/PmbA family protein [unclassified Prochlorococcus]|uniref:TldD/PmbA family protein n=1 Tax=unclassified Prochlorococcus TaxID=2627481 RepID=UPI00056CC9CA|nr:MULTISPECIES: TldD/PmbA family protein [unclassified Prochlorococcus]